MFTRAKMYTVESVTAGHPDKLCDRISDAILDECIRHEPMSRVGIEAVGGHGLIALTGEITTRGTIDYEGIARRLYRDTGYPDEVRVVTSVVTQSPDIAQGVDTGGAGDQGIMYGYATDETPEFMPLGTVLAHALTRGLETLRVNGDIPWLRPDGKSQVTIGDGVVKTVLVSAQHAADVSPEEIRRIFIERLIMPIIGGVDGVEVLVNPTGRFVQGGFAADAGLTGRKIMVDTYGGLIPHGGGCFSGKDPSKVDRSGAYMCRFVAKNLVANGLAKEALVSVAYAIGRAEPLMVEAVNEKGESLADFVRGKFDFRPRAIIERLDLRRPIYLGTAAYGHFGKPGFPWEEVVRL